MGFNPQSFTFSQKLKDIILLIGEEHHEALHEIVDTTSTAGYDNDGSIGPELIDNGVALGFECRDYSKEAEIFFCFDEAYDKTAYYQFGKGEEDALKRLNFALHSWVRSFDENAPGIVSLMARIDEIIND